MKQQSSKANLLQWTIWSYGRWESRDSCASQAQAIPLQWQPAFFKNAISLFPFCSIFFNMGIKELQVVVCVCVRERERERGREGQGEDGQERLGLTSSRR